MKKVLLFFMALAAVVGVNAVEVVDVLKASMFAATSTTYKNFTDVSATSAALYAGNSAYAKTGAIQLRSTGASGIVTTASGGNVRKITVEWNSTTSTKGDRTLDVYVSNEAFAESADLYNSTATKIGTITCGTDTELAIEGDYAYVGLRSNTGAMYLDAIEITWEGESNVAKPEASVSAGVYETAQTVALTAEEGATIKYSVNGGEAQDYTAPIAVTETATIEAWAVVDGEESSHLTLNYVIVVDVNVATALQMIADGKGQEAYVTGYIIAIDEVSTQYGNATYTIADAANATEGLVVFRGYSLNGEKFTAEDEITVGDLVKVYGTLVLYNTTPEVATGSKIVSLKQFTFTDLYIANADFEGDYAVQSNPSADRAIYQPAGWEVIYEAPNENDMTVLNSGDLAYNSFTGKLEPLSGNSFLVRERWGSATKIGVEQSVVLPAGEYLLSASAAHYVGTGKTCIFAGTAEVTVTSKTWEKYSVSFTSDGETPVKIGFYTAQAKQEEQIAGVDNFQVEDALLALKAQLAEAIAQAEVQLASYGESTDYAIALAAAIEAAKTAEVISSEAGQATIAALKTAMDTAAEEVFKETFANLKSGDYLIQNVATGTYLGGANSWGTQASLLPHGIIFTLAQLENGRYTLDSHTYNSDVQHFLGHNLYVDGNAAEWVIQTPDYGIFAFTFDNGNTYMAAPAEGNIITTTAELGEAAQWKMIPVSELVANMQPGDDATFLIKNASISRNLYSKETAWVVSENCTNKNLGGGDNAQQCAESYHSPFDIYQVITVPNGTYQLTAQAFYRQDGSDSENMPVVYANEETCPFPEKTGEENSMNAASNSFAQGLYKIDPITVEVTDGTLRVGVKCDNTSLWCIWDNFELTYVAAPVIPVESLFTAVAQSESYYSVEDDLLLEPICYEGATIEAYSDNSIIIRNAFGVEGCDLKADCSEIHDGDECYIKNIEVIGHPEIEADEDDNIIFVPSETIGTILLSPQFAVVKEKKGYVMFLVVNEREEYFCYNLTWEAEEEPVVEPTPVYTIEGVTTHDEKWDAEEMTAHMVEGALTIKAYEDYVVIKNFDGAEGYDLEVAFDGEGNVTAVNVIHNGEKTNATADWTFSGKDYWYIDADSNSSAESNPETKSGRVFLTGYAEGYTGAYGYYCVEWGVEKPVVTPAEGELDEIATIAIDFGQPITILESDWEHWTVFVDNATLENTTYGRSENVALTAGEKEGEALFVLDQPMTLPGEYVFTIPAGCVQYANGTKNPEFVYHYAVTGNKYEGTLTEGEIAMTITPTDGATVSTLKDFTVNLQGYLNVSVWDVMPILYDAEGNEVIGGQFNQEYDEETGEATGNYTISLDKKVNKAGTYTLKFTVSNTNEDWLQIGEHEYAVTYIVDGTDYVELPTTILATTTAMPAEDNWDNMESFVDFNMTMNVEIGEDYFVVKNLFGIEGYDLRGDLMWGFVGSISLPGVEEPSMMIEVTPNDEIGAIGLFVSQVDLDPKSGYITIQVMGADESSSYIYLAWGDALTSIHSIATNNNDVKAIYNLNGVRLEKPVKGINIINGKKVLVK